MSAPPVVTGGLEFIQGDRIQFRVALSGDDAPPSLIGWSARMDFRRGPGGAAYHQAHSGIGGGLTIDEGNLAVDVDIPQEVTRELPAKVIPTDFWLVDPSGAPVPLFRVEVTIVARHTQIEASVS